MRYLNFLLHDNNMKIGNEPLFINHEEKGVCLTKKNIDICQNINKSLSRYVFSKIMKV